MVSEPGAPPWQFPTLALASLRPTMILGSPLTPRSEWLVWGSEPFSV